MSMTPSRRRVEAYRLKHAAEEGRVIIYRCNACKQETPFLASDVVEIWGPEMQVYQPPASCGQCGVSGRMAVRFYMPTSLDRGVLRLRRPAGQRIVQLWEWGLY